VLGNPELFSRHVLGRALRPYQVEPLKAILASVRREQGQTFTVMFARQMGKNETSAHLECLLLNLYQRRGGAIVKTAPTYQPQTLNSKLRLLTTLDNPLNAGQWWVREGYMVGLGKAACLFVSGHEEARVVGLTASLLLEVDEAQDMDETKYLKDFRPMASSTNATTVLYGTAWTAKPCWRNRRRSIEIWRRAMACAGTFSTIGRRWPGYRQHTGLLWNPRGCG
jgi:hypothetical protein